MPRATLPIVALAALLALPAAAKPVPYLLEPAESIVGFETDFGPDRITGAMPVKSADLLLDFDSASNSRIDVALDVTNAEASFPFAAQAMKGPKVLDSQNFPEMLFRSTAIRRDGDGAEVQGDLTIRGVTRPVVLQATIYRQKGTEEGDLRQLTVQLKGSVRRSDFGATGWLDMVGDEVRLTILARIAKVE
jgi:polyisoprenoid-binding protein YceI